MERTQIAPDGYLIKIVDIYVRGVFLLDGQDDYPIVPVSDAPQEISEQIEVVDTVYTLFDAQMAKNKLFIEFYKIGKLSVVAELGGLLVEFLNNHTLEAFKCAKILLLDLIKNGKITQEDYDLVCDVLLEQNINLNNL